MFPIRFVAPKVSQILSDFSRPSVNHRGQADHLMSHVSRSGGLKALSGRVLRRLLQAVNAPLPRAAAAMMAFTGFSHFSLNRITFRDGLPELRIERRGGRTSLKALRFQWWLLRRWRRGPQEVRFTVKVRSVRDGVGVSSPRVATMFCQTAKGILLAQPV
jgi:hypothetical protein